MNKIQNKTLEIFINRLIARLKKEKGVDVPYNISALYQSMSNNLRQYKEFIADLEKYPDYTISIDIHDGGYMDNLIANITLVKCENNAWDYAKYPTYSYTIQFSDDERMWGYCECTPDMPDYREDKHCCGHGCDAYFSQFELHKDILVVSDSWHGDEHDYWEFEDDFYATDKELAQRKAEDDKKREIKELEEEIAEAQKRLAELEGR